MGDESSRLSRPHIAPRVFEPLGDPANRGLVVIALVTGLVTIPWLALVLYSDAISFVVINPFAKTGFELFLAAGQLFGALVLVLVPQDPMRLRWVAGGVLVLGLGAITFGYLYPLLHGSPNLTTVMYGALCARTVGSVLIAVGLVPAVVPRVKRPLVAGIAALISLLGGLVITFSTRLPPLIRLSPIDRSTEGIASIGELSVTEVERLLAAQDGLFTGLTPWYVSLTMVSVVASAMATWGASRRRWPEPLGTWMLVALSLFAGSQLHSLFFPAMYTSILTTTSFLRLGAVLAIIIGGVLVLRHVIDERTRLLETEQERIRQLEDLAALKADFTRIVAHELATPVAAINTMSDMIAIDDIPTDLRKTTARRIQAEARLLNVLITDVRDSADIERDTFRIDARRVALDALIDEAASYAQTLPGDHPLSIEHTAHTHVLADPDRIGQVLRNLLSNAARYTPAGTPITIRTVRRDGSVTVEVVDSGPGIAPRDQELIFEKFGRGTRALHSRAGGSGLGLYLSRHILHSHHSDLTVDSLPGQGATFRFTLEEMS